ncbi:MAG: hypothetical protein ACRDJU_08775 [Actinomycetota bacterium]
MTTEVFPAPFGPRRPSTIPGGRASEKPVEGEALAEALAHRAELDQRRRPVLAAHRRFPGATPGGYAGSG